MLSSELARFANDPALPAGYVAALRRELNAGADPAIAPGEVYERSLSRTRRRGSGAFYTPGPIAELAVDRTLAPLCAERDLDGVLSMRVADLACGGGVFAGYAVRYLEKHCLSHFPAAVRAVGGRATLRRRLVERCVVAVDVDPAAAQVCRLALALYAGGDAAAMSAARTAVRVADALLDPLEVDELDAVVGNPPWGQKQFRIDREQRAILRQRFRSARGPLDPFKLFVERAHQLLRPGGRWGLVLPDIILLKDQELIRRLILEQSELDLIAHLGRAFEGVNIDAVLMSGRRVTRPRAGHQVELRHSASGAPRWQLQRLFAELPRAQLNIYLDDDSLPLYRNLRQRPTLGQRFEIHEGVHSGNCRRKLFLDRRPEGPTAKLILGRNELSPFRLCWAGRWLNLAPNAVDRDAGEYANLGRPRWHESAKLVVRRTGDRIVAARDLGGHYVSNNLFVLLPRDPDTEAELAAYLALLGSSLYTWYFRTDQPRVGRLFAELKIRHLEQFPLPPPERWRRACASLADAAKRLELGSAPPSTLELIDDIVADLFELDAQARQLVARVPSPHFAG